MSLPLTTFRSSIISTPNDHNMPTEQILIEPEWPGGNITNSVAQILYWLSIDDAEAFAAQLTALVAEVRARHATVSKST